MSEVECGHAVLAAADGTPVLRFEFRGVHDYTHGNQIHQYMAAPLASEVAVGILIEFLAYHYEFGNDISFVFHAGYDKRSKSMRPVCIVAQGRTRSSLLSLFEAGHFDRFCNVAFAETTAEGLDWIRVQTSHPSA